MFKVQVNGAFDEQSSSTPSAATPLLAMRLDIARPPWLFARTCRFLNQAALVVYKSPMLRDVSEMYEPVLAFLGDNEVHVHRHGIFLDADMMLGKGELTVYLTSAEAHPDDDDLSDIEFPGVEEN